MSGNQSPKNYSKGNISRPEVIRLKFLDCMFVKGSLKRYKFPEKLNIIHSEMTKILKFFKKKCLEERKKKGFRRINL